MATKARRPAGRGKKKGGRGWLWLLAGLALGIGAVWAAEHFLLKGKPFSGITALMERKASEPAPVAKPVEPAAAKPKFDFYTMLPANESLLPDTERAPRRPDARDPKEKDKEKVASYILQAAAYANHVEADKLKARLAFGGLESTIEKVAVSGKGEYYRVRLGPYSRLEDLDAAHAKLAAQGIKALRIKVRK